MKRDYKLYIKDMLDSILKIVWKVIKERLPTLKRQLERLLKEIEGEEL